MFQEILIKVLSGDFEVYSKLISPSSIDHHIGDDDSRLRYVPSYKLKVFVSSTFTDTHLERNILLESIVPLLKQIAAPYGIQIIFVDMRYGVRDENTDDHMTWIACRTEFLSCLEQSYGTYFLSLQGNKYGYQPIPKYIPQALFDDRLLSIASLSPEGIRIEDTKLLWEWYQLDSNNIPPRYVLKNLNDINRKIFWKEILPKLRALLKDIAFEADNSDIVIGRSVTEYEARSAVAMNSSGFIWVRRIFTDKGVSETYEKNYDYDDGLTDSSVKLKLNNLIAHIQSEIGNTNTTNIEVSFDSYLAKDSDQGLAYQTAWREHVSNIFMKELNDMIAHKQQWNKDTFGVGFAGADIDEMLHHCKLAHDKCSDFYGRDELLKEAFEAITNSKTNHPINNKYKILLCLIGISGSGKTALMSKLAFLTRQKYVHIPVIIRFCGTSASSLQGLHLINSICRQIELLYQLQQKDISNVYIEAVEYFHMLLSQYPLMLFIDSLDQLLNTNQARSKISFLDGIKDLHSDSRIIVSALPDEQEKGYFYQCDLSLARPNVPRVIVPMLAKLDIDTDINTTENEGNEATQMITSLLSSKARTLTKDQINYVLAQMSIEPTALYAQLAMKVIENWCSYESMEELSLMSTVRGIINQLYDILERDFGKVLVSRMLGLITFSVEGLNINHIQDLLSLDDEVIKDTFQYSKSKIEQIPIHVILRVCQALSGLVVEREENKLAWYHRQLSETAADRYQHLEKRLRLLIAMYFGNLVDEDIRKKRLISEQPFVFGVIDPWFKKTNINRIVCIESIYHSLKCGEILMLIEVYKKLCSLDYICAAIKVGEGFNLILQLIELDAVMQQNQLLLKYYFKSQDIVFEEVLMRVQHYLRWLRKDMSWIVTNPSHLLIATGTSQPYVSKVNTDIKSMFAINNNDFNNKNIMLPVQYDNYLFCSRRLGGFHYFDSCFSVFQGHSDKVYSVAYSPDGSKIVSGSYDKSVRIWDTMTGSEIQKLDGHSNCVTSVAYSPDGSKIVSGSEDKSVRIWDAMTGSEIQKLEGHSSNVTSHIVPMVVKLYRDLRISQFGYGMLLHSLRFRN